MCLSPAIPEPKPTNTLLTAATDALTPTVDAAGSDTDGGGEGFPGWAIVVILVGAVGGAILLTWVLRNRWGQG